MRRMRARVSTSMGGRPTGRRDRRRQSSFHKERCQRMTVARRTMGTAATSDGNNLVMALMVKRSRGLRRGWGAALWRRMTSCLSKVFSATSAARERSVSRSVASTAFATSRHPERVPCRLLPSWLLAVRAQTRSPPFPGPLGVFAAHRQKLKRPVGVAAPTDRFDWTFLSGRRDLNPRRSPWQG
jgi:hypothetical protein